MSNHFVQIQNLTLNTGFVVKIYSIEGDSNLPTQDAIDLILDILNAQQYPRGIVDALEVFTGVAKIEVYDSNNQLLLSSFRDLENN